jgi:type I restriction enzyme, S subunit
MLPEGWRQCRMGDLFESRRERGRPGLPLLSVTMNDGLVDREDLDRKQDSALTPEEHLLVKPGDIAYNTMRMWQGAFGLADREGMVSPAYVVLKPKTTADSAYLAQVLRAPRLRYLLRAFSYGLTEDRLRLYFDDFAAIPVAIPSLKEQRRLARLLAVWDEAIVATEKLLTNRKALKSALAERLLLRPMAVSTECGQVSPSDSVWQRKTLGEIARITSGGTPDRAEPSHWGGEIPWVTTGEIQFNTIRSTAERITESGLRQSSAKLFPPGTLLMAMYGQGKTRGQVAKLGIPAATNQACAAVLFLDGYDPDFYFHYLTAQYEAVRALGNAGTQQNLNAGILKGLPVPVPPAAEQQLIVRVLNCLDQAIQIAMARIQLLTAEKRALLADVLGGKRRLEAETLTP